MAEFGSVRGTVCAACATLALLVAGPVQAQEPALLSLSLGYFDVIDRDDPATEARVEYRSAAAWWLFRPFVGVSGTGDGSVFGYGGLLADIPLGSNWILTPSVAPGLYLEGGGKDLGHWLQIRSQLELAWRFPAGARLGLGLAHISNAGLDDSNPGAEILAVTWSSPIPALFGR